MISISAQDLQRQIGEAQIQAAREPVLITSHGKPRSVLMSVEEFARLKGAAGEPAPSEIRRKGLTYSPNVDPLGYDLRDLDAAMLEMAEDAIAGRGSSPGDRQAGTGPGKDRQVADYGQRADLDLIEH